MYEIDVPTYISPMVVAYGLSKIKSYSKEMSESLYVAEVSPVHKITFSEEFNSSLTIKSSLSPYGYAGCLNKSKSNVMHLPVRLTHWPTLCLNMS